jgi:hypothetical protein
VAQVSSSYLQPLLFLAVIAVVLYVSGQVVKGRGNSAGGEKVLDIAFGVALLAGVYIVIMLLLVLFDEPDLVIDALQIILVMAVFFGALLFLLFGVFELILSRGRRRPRTARESD